MKTSNPKTKTKPKTKNKTKKSEQKNVLDVLYDIMADTQFAFLNFLNAYIIQLHDENKDKSKAVNKQICMFLADGSMAATFITVGPKDEVHKLVEAWQEATK